MTENVQLFLRMEIAFDILLDKKILCIYFTVQNSGFQMFFNFQVVVFQPQTYKLYPYRLCLSRLVCMPSGLLRRYPRRTTSFSRNTGVNMFDFSATVQENDNNVTHMCAILA